FHQRVFVRDNAAYLRQHPKELTYLETPDNIKPITPKVPSPVISNKNHRAQTSPAAAGAAARASGPEPAARSCQSGSPAKASRAAAAVQCPQPDSGPRARGPQAQLPH